MSDDDEDDHDSEYDRCEADLQDAGFLPPEEIQNLDISDADEDMPVLIPVPRAIGEDEQYDTLSSMGFNKQLWQ